MIGSVNKWIREFRGSEDGSTSLVEFMVWFPMFIWITWSGIDLGLMSFKHANLERALDETIREVRLNRLPVGEPEWTHDLLKTMVCDRTYFLEHCSDNLALEMKSVDPRGSDNLLAPGAYCADRAEQIATDRHVSFDRGTSNEMMIIRACYEVQPVWGFTMMGDLASRNPNGEWELHATTVFVHEPLGGSSTPAGSSGSDPSVSTGG
ncbi:TadE/TadG family type IV pilus assembly protein [Ruegeria sp.]|uniref:TadE/TadG family type IV pilus assembly protein n=1 Tax=Ruegeria sp. TaxID=1879320 RepID=UPI003C7A69F6